MKVKELLQTFDFDDLFPIIAIILLVLAVRYAADEGTAQRIARRLNIEN